MHICYFCQKPLEKYVKEDVQEGYYCNFLVCYGCPLTDYFSTHKYEIWRHPYFIVIANDKVISTHLYFHGIKLWCSVFFENARRLSNNYVRISDVNNKQVVSLDGTWDVFSIPPNILENKIKTLVVFS